MIRFKCPSCGTTLQVAAQHAGKTVACPCGSRCKAPAAPVAAAPVAHQAARPATPPTAAAPTQDDEWLNDLSDASAYAASATHPYAPPNAGQPSAAEHERQLLAALAAEHQGGGQTHQGDGEGSSGSIIMGILMMVGALVWFFGGLAAGIIFFYRPILLIIGLVTMCKGLAGR